MLYRVAGDPPCDAMCSSRIFYSPKVCFYQGCGASGYGHKNCSYFFYFNIFLFLSYPLLRNVCVCPVIGADWYVLIDRSDVLDWVDLDKRGDLTGSGLDLVVVGVGNVGKEKDFGGDEDDLSAGIDVDLALSLDFGNPDPSCLGVENGFDLDESLTVGLVAIAVGVTTVVVERFLATIGEGEG